ncbi:MAG: hypothetical protein ABII82_07010 [Verrucomicrobiota bacterium]
MSGTLKNLVAERRAADAAPVAHQVAAAAVQMPALLVHKWGHRSWVLPWAYFLGAQHEVIDEGELLTLSFTFREVVVQGSNLGLLLADIAAYRLETLRELPDKYHEMADQSGPVIRGITVRQAGENR